MAPKLDDDDDEVMEEANLEDEPKRSIRGRKKDKPPTPAKDPAKRGRGRPPGSKTKKSYREEIATQLRSTFTVVAERFDEYCGEIALQRVDPIANAADKCIQRSDRLQRMADTASRRAGPVELLIATWPLVVAVWAHHVVAPRIAAQMQAQGEQPPNVDSNGYEPQTAQTFSG